MLYPMSDDLVLTLVSFIYLQTFTVFFYSCAQCAILRLYRCTRTGSLWSQQRTVIAQCKSELYFSVYVCVCVYM